MVTVNKQDEASNLQRKFQRIGVLSVASTYLFSLKWFEINYILRKAHLALVSVVNMHSDDMQQGRNVALLANFVKLNKCAAAAFEFKQDMAKCARHKALICLAQAITIETESQKMVAAGQLSKLPSLLPPLLLPLSHSFKPNTQHNFSSANLITT
ncbi:hypothetical protein CR513_17325, partial [Mucuna pruriens]